MTAEQKAESLVALMYDVDFWDDEDQTTMQHHHAKQCALIAVNEIFDIAYWQLYESGGGQEEKYWQEVKQHIQQL